MLDNLKAEGVAAPTAFLNTPIVDRQCLNADDYNPFVVSKTRKAKKVIRLFRCFSCDKCYAIEKMSSCLVICKECLSEAYLGARHPRDRFAKKIERHLRKFLRRRLCG